MGDPRGALPLCRESRGYKQFILMYTGYFTLDSPLYLTDFHIVTNSVCACVCVLISIFLPFLYLLFVGFFALSVLLENLLFFYCCESG